MADLHVYEIGSLTIAAKDAEAALNVYIEEEGENLYEGDLHEGKDETVVIHMRRLTSTQIAEKLNPCCNGDGCELCEAAEETVYVSWQDVIDKRKPEEFPCVIAEEE